MTWQTDKVTSGHLSSYLELAEEIGPAGVVCEIGVQRGYSLEMWQEFFPKGRVVGIDYDPRTRWPEGTVRILIDQQDDQLAALVRDASPDGKYDLIVDDGSHYGEPTRKSWEMLWELVRSGCCYVIEDWSVGIWGNKFNPLYGDSMLRLAEWFLSFFHTPGIMEIDSITYKFGLIIIRKVK